MRSIRILDLTLIAVVLAASACTGSPTPGPDHPRPTLEFPTGGTLRVVSISYLTPTTLDPSTYNYEAWEVLRCCLLRTLMSFNGRPTDEGGAEVRPDLAARPPDVSTNDLQWTFHLRPGLHYAPPFQHREIVTGDVIRALEREARLGDGYASYFSVIQGFDAYARGRATSVSGLQAPDAHTLVVHLTEPAGDLGYRLALPAAAPLPPHVADGHPDYGPFLVASGPYMFAGSRNLDFSRPPKKQRPASGYGGLFRLVRNPSWDRSTDPLHSAYPDRIELRVDLPGVFPGLIRRAYGMVERGTEDVVMDWPPLPAIERRYRSSPRAAPRLRVYPISSVAQIAMNLAVPPFDDLHVRRAVSLAIDKPELRRVLPEAVNFGVQAQVADHIAPDALEGRLLLNYGPSWEPRDPRRRLSAARYEMRQSKYDRNGDGRCDSSVCHRVVLVTDTAWPRQFDPVAEDDFRTIGIHLVLRRYPFDVFSSANGPESPVARSAAMVNRWATDFPNGSVFFPDLFYSRNLRSQNLGAFNDFSMLGAQPGQLRRWGYHITHVPGVDDQIAQCQAAVGLNQERCWADLDKYLMEKVVPWVPFLFEAAVRIVSPRVAHYSFDQSTGLPALDQIALKPGST